MEMENGNGKSVDGKLGKWKIRKMENLENEKFLKMKSENLGNGKPSGKSENGKFSGKVGKWEIFRKSWKMKIS